MILKPRHDNIVVLIDAPETQKGAIHIPKAAVSLPNTGIVLEVGPAATSCKPGDHVLINSLTAHEIQLGRKLQEHRKIVTISERFVCGVLTEGEWENLPYAQE